MADSWTRLAQQPLKRRKSSSSKRQQDARLWSDRHEPTSVGQLAVHRKKIDEIRGALLAAITGGPRIVLCTGPPGCAKTAAVKALVAELGCSVVEWVNPTSPKSFDWDHSGREEYTSLRRAFYEFLMRAQSYSALSFVAAPTASSQGARTGLLSSSSSINGAASQSSSQQSQQRDPQLVLVEDLPTAVFMRGQEDAFHQVLAALSKRMQPVVFIIQETQSTGVGSLHFFARALAQGIACRIRFNPIAPTAMKKALASILDVELHKTKSIQAVPPQHLIDALIEASDGDLRSATNNLQFLCTQRGRGWTDAAAAKRAQQQKRKRRGTAASTSSATTSDPSETSHESTLVLRRDHSLKLFHALGKVLCSKRTASATAEGPAARLVHRLSGQSRQTMNMKEPSPEAVVDQAHMSPGMFTLFLHQNYLDFFGTLDDAVAASHHFSDADLIDRVFDPSGLSEAFASSVAVRGALHANHHPSASRWRPLHKPELLTVRNEASLLKLQCSHAFEETMGTSERVFVSETAPMLRLLGTQPLFAQTQTLQKLGIRESGHCRRRSAFTDKDDLAADEEEFDGAEPDSSTSQHVFQRPRPVESDSTALRRPTCSEDVQGFSSDEDGEV